MRSSGKLVVGASGGAVNPGYALLCDGFVPLPARDEARTGPLSTTDTSLELLLAACATECADSKGWIDLSRLAQAAAKKQPGFKARKYGYRKFSELVKATGIFESRGQGSSKRVRLV